MGKNFEETEMTKATINWLLQEMTNEDNDAAKRKEAKLKLAREAIKQKKQFEFISGQWPVPDAGKTGGRNDPVRECNQ